MAASATGWVLEETGSLTGWAPSARTITILNGQCSITTDDQETKGFFRLKYQ